VVNTSQLRYIKIAMLVGWIAHDTEAADSEEWIKDGNLAYDTTSGPTSSGELSNELERLVWGAVKIVEGLGDDAGGRPRGFTRASACALRGTEESCHGIADVLSMQVPHCFS
jgi:hypothetical protein